MSWEDVYSIAGNIAAVVKNDPEVSAFCVNAFGTELAVYLGGLDTFDQEDRCPYFLVSPTGYDRENGSRTSTIHATLAIRADGEGDSSKGAVNEDGVVEVGRGQALLALLDKVEDAIRDASVGAILETTGAELDLTDQYPVQSAELELTLTDIETF